MVNANIYALIILTVFNGGIFSLLGWIMKSQNAGDMLNRFDDKKYSKDKVSMIIGRDYLYTGLLIILLGIIGIFLNSKFYKYIGHIQMAITIIGLSKSIHDMNKKCRIET